MIFDPSIRGLGYAPDDDDFNQDDYDNALLDRQDLKNDK